MLEQQLLHLITRCVLEQDDYSVGPRGYTLQLFCVLMMTNQIRAI